MPTKLSLQTDMSDFSSVAADSTGNTFDNSTGQVYLHVIASWDADLSTTITIPETRTCSFGHAQGTETHALARGQRTILGPFDILKFNNAAREVSVSFSAVTGIFVAAVKG